MISQQDIHWMAQALQQARKGLYTTAPNPRVGCVIVKQSQLLSTGYHQRAGQPHAERNALNALTPQQAAGASCYVTLEPCSHVGRTEPCADALIAARVSRVVVAMVDPNPKIAGSGIERLRAAGISVDVGALEAEAKQLNPGFIKRFSHQRPWVRVKQAISLDGRTAMASGESFWITGAAAREDVQRLRARSCAIVTGIGTLLADNPSLTVRDDEWRLGRYASDWVRQPLRVVLDSNGQADKQAKLFSASGDTLVVTATDAAQQRLQQQGINSIALGQSGGVNLTALLDELARRQCNEVLVEAGASLSSGFVEAGLVDELIVYQAPVLLGQKARPMLALDIDTMANKRSLRLLERRALGDDWRYSFGLKA